MAFRLNGETTEELMHCLIGQVVVQTANFVRQMEVGCDRELPPKAKAAKVLEIWHNRMKPVFVQSVDEKRGLQATAEKAAQALNIRNALSHGCPTYTGQYETEAEDFWIECKVSNKHKPYKPGIIQHYARKYYSDRPSLGRRLAQTRLEEPDGFHDSWLNEVAYRASEIRQLTLDLRSLYGNVLMLNAHRHWRHTRLPMNRVLSVRDFRELIK